MKSDGIFIWARRIIHKVNTIRLEIGYTLYIFLDINAARNQ